MLLASGISSQLKAGILGSLQSGSKWILACFAQSPLVQSNFGQSLEVLSSSFNLFDFLGGSNGKESVYSAGDPGLICGPGRSPGGGRGNPLQYSCLENLMDRGAWWAIVHTVHGVAKSWTRLSD